MSVVPRLVRRYPGLVDLSIKDRAGVSRYDVGGALTLNLAYAGTAAMFSVKSGGSYASPRVVRAQLNHTQESNRGLTRALYNPNDFASADLPGDSDISFISVREVDSVGNVLGAGPILVVPPPDFFETGRRNLVLVGNAPNVAGRPNNLPPVTAMRIFLPRFADELTVYNEEAALGNSLYFSLGLGLPEMRVPANSSRTFAEAGANEILIRGSGGAVAFSISAAIVNGIQA